MCGTPAHSRAPRSVYPFAIASLLCLALAWAALSIGQYRFGVVDQAQYLVQYHAARDSAAFPGDPYLEAFPALGSTFWNIMALVPERWIEEASLAVALGAAWLNAMLLCGIGRALLRGTVGEWPTPVRVLAYATPALCLVVAKEENWFGLVALADSELTATSAVMPLLFASLLAWTSGRPLVSLALAAAAVPIQGQTGAYLLTTWVVASLAAARGARHRLLLPTALGVAGTGALWLARGAFPVAPERLGEYRGLGLGLYPELIDPWTSPGSAWAALGAVLTLGALAAIAHFRSSPHDACGTPHTGERAAFERLLVWSVASLAFPLIGLGLLAAGAQEPLLWRLMVGRAFMPAQIGAVVVFAAWAVATLARCGAGRVRAGVALALVAIWPSRWVDATSAAALTSIAVGLVGWDALVRGGMRTRGGAAMGENSSFATAPWANARGVLIGVFASVVVLASVTFALRPFPWLRTGEERAWQEVQQWAKRCTPAEARFLTPPHRSGWRVGSMRRTYGEVKDGTLLFYAGARVLEWADRMERLGACAPYHWVESRGPEGCAPAWIEQAAEQYACALEGLGEALCAQQGINWVVTEGIEPLPFADLVWANKTFGVHRVRTPRADFASATPHEIHPDYQIVPARFTPP